MKPMERSLRREATESGVEGVVRPVPLPLTFEEFFLAERTRLLQALIVITADRTEAEEILQDAFLKVFERWDRVSTMASPVGFLYRVAMNLHRSRLRRAALSLQRTFRGAERRDDLEEVEARDEAVRLMNRLTPRERAAIVFTAYFGYSGEETAEILGIRASTVRVLTSRARAALRTEGGDAS